MLESLKRVVRRSPLAGPSRWLHRWLWPLSMQELDARYNAETEAVMARVLTPDSICLDIGAHTGTVLQSMVRLAPRGRHWAFEPLPACVAHLRATFPHVHVCEVALSDRPGPVTFEHAVTDPGWSGLKRRDLGFEMTWETLTVQAARLDDLVSPETPVAFVKIDVEGAELGVLRGGARLLQRHRPVIVFEHGLGNADAFGTQPEHVWDWFTGVGYRVSTMARWLTGQRDLTRDRFRRQFATHQNVYFLAYPVPGQTPNR
jgi:FkbM family methyltransferase